MMNDITIKGFPTITVRDKNTGNVIIEKHLKNNATVIAKIRSSHLIGALFSPQMNISRYNSYTVFDLNGESSVSIIGVTPYRIPNVSRFISVLYNTYRNIFGYLLNSSGSYYSASELNTNGEAITFATSLQAGVKRVRNSMWGDDGEFYIEFYGQLSAPESGTRTIGSVLLSRNYGQSSTHAYEDSIGAIVAAVSLEEEIVQDDTMIVDITYKLIIPKNINGLSESTYNNVKLGLAQVIGTNTPKNININPFSNFNSMGGICTHSMKFNYNDKYNYRNFIIDDAYNKSIEHNTYSNLWSPGRLAELPISLLKTYKINYNKDMFGRLYGSSKYLYNGMPLKSRQKKTDDSRIPIDVNLNEEINEYTLKFPISPNVYSHHKALDGNDKPFLDISNYRKGMADMSVKINNYNSDTPEMYFIDITRGGEQGVARAKITKRPFFSAYNNNFEGSSYSLPHLSSNLGYAHSYTNNGTNLYTYTEESMFKHRHGYEYQNGGDRHPLSDGHVLIVTRKGVLLSHIKIIDYEIYDKDSTPQLPVKMITSIAHNYNTGDTFIGCAETGLYKFNKSLRNSNPATIEKISGIEKVYTMNTDGYGNISIVTNHGLKITKNNCQSFETFDHTRMNSSEIISNEDFIKINTLATDFESENLNTMIVFNDRRSNNLGLFFSKDGSGKDIEKLLGEGSRSYSYISDLASFNDPIEWYKKFAYSSNMANTFIMTPRFLQSVPDIGFIKRVLHKDFKNSGEADIPHKENLAVKLLESLNTLPHRLIRSYNGKFYLNICGLSYEFEFNNNSLIKIYNKLTNNSTITDSFSSASRRSGTGTTNDSLMIGAKFSNSIIMADDYPVTILGHGESWSSNQDTNMMNGYPSESNYSSYIRNRISEIKDNYTNDTGSSRNRYNVRHRHDVLYVEDNGSFSTMNQCLNWATYGSIIIDEFKDSGLALVTGSSGTEKAKDILSSDELSSRLDYDEIFNSYMPNDECMNVGRVSLRTSYLWNIRQPINKRFGSSSKFIDKEVKVNQAEDFLIPEGKLTIGDIDLFFDSKSSGNNAYVEGDYYSFVNYDGIVHDNFTTFSLEFEGAMSNITENTYSQKGIIEKSENTHALNIRSFARSGFGGQLSDGTIFTTSEASNFRFHHYNNVLIGDFKASIDLSNVRGGGMYRFGSWNPSNSLLYTDYFTLWVGDHKGKKFIFPTTSDSAPSVSISNINRYTISNEDTLTVEFNSINRSFIVRKNGDQIYTSGSISSLSAPFIKVSIQCMGIMHSDSGSRFNHYIVNNDSRYSSFTPWAGPSVIPPLVFEYSNRGYTMIHVGDNIGKTGVFDPKFVGIPVTMSDRSISIKIDNKDAVISTYSINTTLPSSKSDNSVDIFSPMHNMTNDIYPTTLQSGQVAIFHDLGLIMFSQEDIGKKYSIDYRYYKDAIIGVDEFAEESDIPQDPE